MHLREEPHLDLNNPEAIAAVAQTYIEMANESCGGVDASISMVLGLDLEDASILAKLKELLKNDFELAWGQIICLGDGGPKGPLNGFGAVIYCMDGFRLQRKGFFRDGKIVSGVIFEHDEVFTGQFDQTQVPYSGRWESKMRGVFVGNFEYFSGSSLFIGGLKLPDGNFFRGTLVENFEFETGFLYGPDGKILEKWINGEKVEAEKDESLAKLVEVNCVRVKVEALLVVDHLERFMDDYWLEIAAKAEGVNPAVRQQALAIERSFVEALIRAFEKWSSETNPIVLWDIDDTLGDYVEESWRDRFSLSRLLPFLKKHFPNVRNGILSDRLVPVQRFCLGLNVSEDEIKSAKQRTYAPNELEGYAGFFDPDLLFTSDSAVVYGQYCDAYSEVMQIPDQQQGSYYKLAVLKNMLDGGQNVKSIDELTYAKSVVWVDGVCVENMRPAIYLRSLLISDL